MTLPSWDSLPIRTKRSRKRLYGVIAAEYSLTAWKSLPHNVKRSKKHLYNYIASQKNLEEYDELAKNNMRSTRLLYNYIKDNASGSKPTLTIKVKDGESNVSGATVTIGTTEKTTDSDGEVTYSLDFDNYTVSVEKSGYLDYTENIKFRANHKTFTIPLVAEPVETGTVTVTCEDSSEQPITGAGVIIGSEPLEDISQWQTWAETYGLGMGVTGSDGSCTVMEIEQGQPTQTPVELEYGTYYLFAFEQVNSIYYYGSLTVDGDETVTITLTTPVAQTGTVTVTCQRELDGEYVPVGDAIVMLYTGDTPPSQQDDSNMVGLGQSGNDGVAVIYAYDTTTHQPTQVTDIPFGTYTVSAPGVLSYTGSLTVDGDEEVTITLTSE